MESSSPGPHPPAKLERIGRYRIVRPLSKGGMALVYEARRESLAGVSPRVAIKVILPEFGESDTFQELFINEARLGASLHHQNLVQIQEFDKEGDRFFLVMEYVEGVTLRRAISLCRRHGVRIPMGVVAEIGRQACDGLHYAHQASDEHGNHLRLVHRDVKPSNLILNPHGVVKLLDFGISKGRLIRERSGTVKGTWGYMAPEQAFGKEVGAQADVFGLATVLYELSALRVLFEGQDKTQIKRLLMDDHAARLAAMLDPIAYGPIVPTLVRALQRDPQGRYENAADFGRALSALLPDPITARDEVVAFYRMVQALQDGIPLERAARELRSEVSPSQGSMVASAHTGGGESSGPVWLLVGLAAFALALVLLFASILVLQGVVGVDRDPAEKPQVAEVLPADPPATVPLVPRVAFEEPAGPAGEGAPGEERPPPLASRTIPDERPPPERAAPEPTTTRPPVMRTRVEPTSAPAPVVVVLKKDAPPSTGSAEEMAPGLLTVGARQDGEVYVNGRFVRKVPLLKHELPPGDHTVLIVASDGRRKQFEVSLETGVELRRVWDFDSGEWRR